MRNEPFRIKLQEELVKRIKKNPSFSARAFAKQLDIEPSSLTQIINGKRTLTDKMCQRLAEKLSMSPEEMYSLMGVTSERSEDSEFLSFTKLSEDNFKVIADWYHYVILELTYLKHFKGDYRWIARALGITVHEVRSAVERLIRLEFLEITSNGKWQDKLGDANNLGNEFTAPAMKRLQKQILQKAIIALDEVPYEERVQTSMTLPVSRKKVTEAKKRILSFIEDLDAFLKTGEDCDEVYNMSFSLYPISNSRKGE